MKRHKALILLSHDHHKGLLLAQLLKKNAPPYKGLPTDPAGKMNYAIEAFKSDLTIHFKDEEEILFPLLRNKTSELDTLIDELLDEHKKIEDGISSLNKSDDLVVDLNKIGVILENHIRKEERILFQMAQSVLSEVELTGIESGIENSRENFKRVCLTSTLKNKN
ncbi:MAG TPA: hemerythrin domain-containing protein [Ignavibacteriaceae bacterium]|nr:hemerythrin domain-containing protein [Ignavibacteriaceae bacterium]